MYVCGMMAVVAMISEGWRESDDFGAGHTCLIAEKVFRRQMRRHSNRSRVQYAFWGGRDARSQAPKNLFWFFFCSNCRPETKVKKRCHVGASHTLQWEEYENRTTSPESAVQSGYVWYIAVCGGNSLSRRTGSGARAVI